MNDRIKGWLLAGLGTGWLRPAPGTWGSLAAAGVWLAGAALVGPAHPNGLAIATGLAMFAASAVCVGLGGWIVARTGNDDPQTVTADEWAGQWMALLGVPMFFGSAALTAGVQLLLFRLFDITKPPPCHKLERLPAGWGILADDLMAGFYANLVGHAGYLAVLLMRTSSSVR